MNGSNYISMPYNPVQAFSVSNDAITPSGGGTATQGFWYHWDINGGFSGRGWFVGNGPMKGFASDDDVVKYLTQGGELGNLNQQFTEWNNYLNSLDSTAATWEADQFHGLVSGANGEGIKNGCVERVV